MLGLVRFVLAFAVLLSHVPGFEWPLNPGVIAVLCFYCISGYLMRRSFERFARFSSNPSGAFLTDRLLKLFPQYLAALGVTTALIWLWGPSPGFWLMQQQLSPLKILLNALLLPANYIFGPIVIAELLPHPLVPPGWSLATEFHFYLLLPLLFRWWRLLMALLVMTLAIQLYGFTHDSPTLNSDSLGYRYIFGVLPVFLMGYLYADQTGIRTRIAGALWLGYVVLAIFAVADLGIHQQRAREVLIGASIALPLLVLSLRYRQDAHPHFPKALDERLGNLAYPIFITHCLAFYVIEHVTGLQVQASARFVLGASLLCLLFSVVLDAMQRHVERLRIRVRGFASMKNATPQDA